MGIWGWKQKRNQPVYFSGVWYSIFLAVCPRRRNWHTNTTHVNINTFPITLFNFMHYLGDSLGFNWLWLALTTVAQSVCVNIIIYDRLLYIHGVHSIYAAEYGLRNGNECFFKRWHCCADLHSCRRCLVPANKCFIQHRRATQSHLNANQMVEKKRLKGDKMSTGLIEYSLGGQPDAF